jgi:hypothetical protein
MPDATDAPPLRDASGLCVRVRGVWIWLDEIGDLGVAAAWPLEAPLDDQLLALFSANDPWRTHANSLEALKAQLARRSRRISPQSAQAAATRTTCQCRIGHSTIANDRCLQASKPVSRGELLLQEEAHAAALWPHCHRTHCHHCLMRLDALASPAMCGRSHACPERYCSQTCRDAAWIAGHDAECGTLFHTIAPRTVLMSLRALLRGEREAGQEDDSPAATRDGSGSLDRLLALRDHEASMGGSRLSLLRFHAHLAHHVARAAVPAPNAGQLSRDEAGLARLLRLCLTNSFAVREESSSSSSRSGSGSSGSGSAPAPLGNALHAAASGEDGGIVGEALYVWGSLFNHSCEPNTTVRHVGRGVQVRASQALLEGDEALICYGPQAGYMPLKKRREQLERVYYFECCCPACKRELQPETAEEKAPQPRQKRQSPPDASALRLRAQRIDDQAREACERGQFCEAAELTARAIGLLERVFAPGSTQLAHEYAKLGRLRFNDRPDGRARASLRSAASELEACYGDEYDEVAELRHLAAMCRS